MDYNSCNSYDCSCNNFFKKSNKAYNKISSSLGTIWRGEDIEEFRPSGALEIRKAGLEFEKMKKNSKTSKSKI